MNGKNKRWLEQRWDRKQPARLAHIHKARKSKKEKSLPDTTIYFVLGYRTGHEIDERHFEGKDLIETHSRATRWVDENFSNYDRTELRNADYKLLYAR